MTKIFLKTIKYRKRVISEGGNESDYFLDNRAMNKNDILVIYHCSPIVSIGLARGAYFYASGREFRFGLSCL
jgi:hypothetical protein